MVINYFNLNFLSYAESCKNHSSIPGIPYDKNIGILDIALESKRIHNALSSLIVKEYV